MSPNTPPAGEGVSTSALAKRLNLPAHQLFVTLRDYGWIERRGESWLLTAKGEYEGGRYQSSKRFGTYIVWPPDIEHHPLLQAIESNQRVSADTLRRYYPHLHARAINRVLAELGLQCHTLLGWELTEAGRRLGGQQAESDPSGAWFVTWPHDIVDHPVVHRELSRHAPPGQPLVDTPGEPDLFAVAPLDPAALRGLDGHQLATPLERRVCDWLYLAQLAHAHQRSLPTEAPLTADFYLPAGCIYIDCWDESESAAALSGRLARRDAYAELALRHIEITPADAERLDERLGRALLAFGLRF